METPLQDENNELLTEEEIRTPYPNYHKNDTPVFDKAFDELIRAQAAKSALVNAARVEQALIEERKWFAEWLDAILIKQRLDLPTVALNHAQVGISDIEQLKKGARPC